MPPGTTHLDHALVSEVAARDMDRVAGYSLKQITNLRQGDLDGLIPPSKPYDQTTT
ncbi:hypothetical protein [Nitrososphaera sp. AFS]|uniref:hypothetical protein n=1 Tax=Nitrososphaera sp. AFS TaxID=2301191 RepID=UPI00139246B8|nr:hypothetical protein [Nitrososphaera sp. AFS]